MLRALRLRPVGLTGIWLLLESLHDQLPELVLLIGGIFYPRDRPQRPFREGRPMRRVGQGEDVVPDLGWEAEQSQNLRHPGAGDSLPAGDSCSVAAPDS